jgi:uncharacterized protein YydD (DUF2326 family)
MEAEIENRTLTCTLTEAELKAKADELAALVDKHNALVDEKKRISAQYKIKIDALKADLDLAAAVVRDRKEVRSVECRWITDFYRNVVKLVRTDTYEEIESRAMTAEERQRDLFSSPPSTTRAIDETPPALASDDAPEEPSSDEKVRARAKKRGRKAKAKA